MAITPEQVRTLREKTGAGMMDCKRCLEQTGGDEQEAVRLLREKGMATAAKREGRQALAAYLPRQRWFGAKGRQIVSLRLLDHAVLAGTPRPTCPPRPDPRPRSA